jgi:hypothetical protein
MTRNSGDDVTIYLYHVVDGGGVHRFRTTNNRFIEYLGGIGAVEERLGNQFLFVELIGTCPFRTGNDAGQGFDDIAGNDIATKIKAIAHQYPDCDPLPQPWSAGEHRKDIAKSVCEAIAGSSDALNKEIISDLLQIQTTIGADIDAIVALIHYQGGLRASLVQRDAEKSGLTVHDGGVPAKHVSIIAVPDPTRHSSKWVAIPPAKLSISLSPPPGDQPVAYLVICASGRHALALAGHRDGGLVCWSGNADLIDMITHLLADVGILNRSHISTSVKP